MTSIDAAEATMQFAPLLKRVERGEEVVITRHGKPVAKLVSVEDPDQEAHTEEPGAARLDSADRLIADMRALRERTAVFHRETGQPPVTAGEIKRWIEEGRR